MSPSRVPAILISGFLGSGKTTLVRNLLRDARVRGTRLAVVSNEYGELGIDRALLGEGAESFVELDGGCVCCKLSDELVETLEMLRARVQPDAIVVETSGVAIPYDVQLNFWREPVASWLRDDVVVVVVNAEQVLEGRDLNTTFETQLSCADLILLNQVDRVPECELDRIEEELRRSEPDAPLIRTVHASISPELLFPPDPQDLRGRRRRLAAPAEPHQHEEFSAEEIRFDEALDPEALVSELRELGALRIKGFVRTTEGLRLVQGVGQRIELELPEVEPPADLVGRLALITRDRKGRGATRAVSRRRT